MWERDTNSITQTAYAFELRSFRYHEFWMLDASFVVLPRLLHHFSYYLDRQVSVFRKMHLLCNNDTGWWGPSPVSRYIMSSFVSHIRVAYQFVYLVSLVTEWQPWLAMEPEKLCLSSLLHLGFESKYTEGSMAWWRNRFLDCLSIHWADSISDIRVVFKHTSYSSGASRTDTVHYMLACLATPEY